MTFNHGSVAKMSLDANDVSLYLNEAGLEREVDTAETSALGTVAKTYVPGLTDATFKLSGMFDPTFDALMDGFHGDASIPFVYRPAGDGAGTKPEYVGSCILSSYEISTSVDDMAEIDAEFQVTGPVTRQTQAP
jgi:hypothetical protein